MEQVSGRSFSGEEVETDGRSFADCSFANAALVYRGGEHPLFERCSFGPGVSWRFLGPALATVQLLQRILGVRIRLRQIDVVREATAHSDYLTTSAPAAQLIAAP